MTTLLLAAAFLPLVSSNLCPTGLNMSLIQENLAPRPKGEVALTCSITGVSSSDIEYYMWLVEELLSPIYTYSEPHEVDQISPGNIYFVKSVTHAPSKTGLESRLTLVLNVTNKDTYRCEIKIHPDKHCSKTTSIQIQDPRLSLTFEQNSIQESDSTNSSTIETICSVDVSLGAPSFEVSYNGTELDLFKILKEERRLESHGYYQNGSYLTTLVIPHSGVIVCTASDSLGTYTARKEIPVPDCVPTVSPNPSSSTSIVIFVTVVVVVGLIIVAVIPIILHGKRRRRRTLQRRGRTAEIDSECHGTQPLVSIQRQTSVESTAEIDSECHGTQPLVSIQRQTSVESTDRLRLSNAYEYTSRMSNVSNYDVLRKDKILKGYFSMEWDWKKIKDLSDDPVLYAGSGPTISDVHQGLDVDDDSWFLAALNSLCLAYEKGHWQEFHEIFGECKDLKGSEIPIKLWRYGEWKTIYVTPSLPTKDGKLCFMHSSNCNVFWSALLQKAYAQEYITYSGLDGERDIHILEDLTGGIVRNYKNNDYQEESRTLYSALNLINKNAIALTWKTGRAERIGFIFHSVIEVHEKGRKVSYRVFPPADRGIEDFFDSSHALKDSMTIRTMQSVDLFSTPEEYTLLYKDTDAKSYTCLKSFSGIWKHSQVGNNYRNDLFWKNPQYLLGFHRLTDDHGDFVQICIAVMQKDTADGYTTAETIPWPLKIGLKCFRITDETFRPMNPLARMRPGIRSDWKIPPRYTREVRGWWTIPIDDRLIIVPTVEGGNLPADFLFRVFTDKPHVTKVVQLPPHADSEECLAISSL